MSTPSVRTPQQAEQMPPPVVVAVAIAPSAAAPKPWWQSKVLWLNVIALGLTAAEAHLGLLQPLLPVDVYALVAFVLPVANGLLRAVSTGGGLSLRSTLGDKP